MEYDRGDNSSFDFKLNAFPFGSKVKGKLSPQSYFIKLEKKWKSIFLSILILSQGNRAFRHVETLFVQGNQVRTDQNRHPFYQQKRFVLISTNLITLDE